MNGKFILILFVCLNVATLVGSSVCQETVNSCSFGTNPVLSLFISDTEIEAIGSDPGTISGAGFNDNFTESVSGIVKQQSSGTFIDTSGISFLDGLRMILGLLTLLTPIPLIAFVITSGLPLVLVLLLGLIPILIYILSIMEFIRGASF